MRTYYEGILSDCLARLEAIRKEIDTLTAEKAQLENLEASARALLALYPQQNGSLAMVPHAGLEPGVEPVRAPEPVVQEFAPFESLSALTAVQRQERVLAAIVAKGPLTAIKLASLLDMNISHVYRALNSLKQAQLLTQPGSGEYAAVKARDAVVARFAATPEGFALDAPAAASPKPEPCAATYRRARILASLKDGRKPSMDVTKYVRSLGDDAIDDALTNIILRKMETEGKVRATIEMGVSGKKFELWTLAPIPAGAALGPQGSEKQEAV